MFIQLRVVYLPATRVLSIRINKKTQECLERNAKILNLKISVLAAKVLEEKTDEWSKEYATRIFHELGLDRPRD
jgi:antitoxin component of RelBE/YafQ-DinJ toxin-antitoxin module